MTSSPRWLSDSEQRAWRAIQQFGAPLAAALNRQLMAESSLSSADYQVLVVLTEGAPEGLRAGQLGRATGWEKSRLSHHLKRMEARGLVRREECRTDGRGLLVVITPAGRQAIAEAAPGHVAAVRDLVIDALTPEQLQVLAAAGEAVGTRLTAVNCRAAEADGFETAPCGDSVEGAAELPSAAVEGVGHVSTSS